jgi:hypothetical protein
MMEKLYRKRILPSGRVRYEEAFQFDDMGDIIEGLWVHQKTHIGRSYSWVSEYCGPVPEIPESLKNRAALEVKRQDVLDRVNNTRASFDAIVSACFDVIAEG